MNTACVLVLSRSQQMAFVDVLGHYLRDKNAPQEFIDMSTDPAAHTTAGSLLTLVMSAPPTMAKAIEELQDALARESATVSAIQYQRDQAYLQLKKHGIEVPL